MSGMRQLEDEDFDSYEAVKSRRKLFNTAAAGTIFLGVFATFGQAIAQTYIKASSETPVVDPVVHGLSIFGLGAATMGMSLFLTNSFYHMAADPRISFGDALKKSVRMPAISSILITSFTSAIAGITGYAMGSYMNDVSNFQGNIKNSPVIQADTLMPPQTYGEFYCSPPNESGRMFYQTDSDGKVIGHGYCPQAAKPAP